MREGPLSTDIGLAVGACLIWAYRSAWTWWPLVLAGYWVGKRQIDTRTLVVFAVTEAVALLPFIQLLRK
jgi:hypothetical protein